MLSNLSQMVGDIKLKDNIKCRLPYDQQILFEIFFDIAGI
jgi:hypothetical protein